MTFRRSPLSSVSLVLVFVVSSALCGLRDGPCCKKSNVDGKTHFTLGVSANAFPLQRWSDTNKKIDVHWDAQQ